MSRKHRHEPDGAPVASVGRNVPRAEGREKVTGEARYVDDLHLPDLLHGATVRSEVPVGRIAAVERDPAFDWSGFTFVDYLDVPRGGRNVVAMITEDQPFLVESRVQHREEPILLLAHADRTRLAEGVRHVKVRYEAEPTPPPALTLDDASEVLKEISITKGDVDAAFRREGLVVVEGTYRTGHQEQLYIETNGMIALPDKEGDPEGVTVYGSMQCPYYVVKALKQLFGIPEEKVRVVQTVTGGGFGGKEEYPSILAGHAALLARKAGRPVKMIYDRQEDLAATTKRHPSLVRHRTALTQEGEIVAIDVDLRLDGGAYVTLSPVVLSRACIHATGPYRAPNVRIRGRVMKTHTPPNGAFRGFGAPQSQFAAEVHMDRIAERMGLDPVALRRRNLLRPGDTTATGQLLEESVSAEEVLDRALRRHAAAAEAAGPPPDDGKRRGTGLALFFHGSGFTGGGEVRLASRAGIELIEGGEGVRLLVGSTEIGQGTRTMHAQIVADALAIPYHLVVTSDPDTALVPDSGPTVASRTCMVVGQILSRAAARLREALGPYETPKEFRRAARALLEKEGGPVRVVEQYERTTAVEWSDETYRGDAYGAYAWGCNIADVEVDPLTAEARCGRLTAVIDVGKAIHPRLVEGQIEGGSLQGVGWALYEEVVMRDGRMANAQLTNYIIPTTLDTPVLDVEIVENPYRSGPFGAKGVGECPIDGPAAAIVNGLRAATGARLDAIPATPERILRALDAVAGGPAPASSSGGAS